MHAIRISFLYLCFVPLFGKYESSLVQAQDPDSSGLSRIFYCYCTPVGIVSLTPYCHSPFCGDFMSLTCRPSIVLQRTC
jgi:hypothetical protein